MLRKSFKIYVPSTVNVNQEIDNSVYVEKTARFLSENFGGCTCMPAHGSWVASDNSLVQESVTICYAFCNALAYYKAIATVRKFAHELCVEMSQEAISVEFNNKLSFVD